MPLQCSVSILDSSHADCTSSTSEHWKVKDFRQFCIICLLLLTPWCKVLLEKLTGLQLVKKFPAFHGTRRFITALTSVRHLSLTWASPIHMPTTQLLEIRPNIIHPSTPRSPQWSLSLRFPHQDPIRPPLLTHTRHLTKDSTQERQNLDSGKRFIRTLYSYRHK